MRFLEVAQNVSKEQLQDLLAQILSSEIQEPGRFSYQTLEVIRYLSYKDLQIFLKFVAVSTDVGVVKLHGNSSESLDSYDLSFHDYLELASIGLFNQSSTISLNFEVPAGGNQVIRMGVDVYVMQNQDASNSAKINFGVYVFSKVGQEIRSLLLKQAQNAKLATYIADFVEKSREKGFKVSKLEVANNK